MISGVIGKKYHIQSPEKAARLSHWLPDIDVVGAQDGFSWCRCLALLRLAAKLSNVGSDVDELVCRLHRSTNSS
jgi:hypothetical protein